MYGNLKRFVSIVITIAVIMTMTITPGFADDTPIALSEQDEAAGEEVIQEEIETYTYSQGTGEDEEGYNDELFARYVEENFFPELGGYSSDNIMLRSIHLSERNQIIYSILKSQIEEVAAGNSTSAVFTVGVDDLGLTDASWTAEDLGVSQLRVNGQLTNEAKTALMNLLEIDTKKVMDALLAQCPYELYWYDKTAGVSISGPGYRIRTIGSYSEGVETLYMTSGFTFKLTVASGYASGQYEVSPYNMGRVMAAIDAAQEIVSEAADLSDYEKLIYYKDRICEEVSYNYEATDPSYEYGDPWQLISVFDRDETTNVVCEGYSKAFKYLCDQTAFDEEGLECIIVSGTMSGATGAGNHMWNIVTINGGNYLVDVTNCDEGTIGAPDQLFLMGTENGSVQDGYTFTLSGGDIYYSYNDNTLGTYNEELVLMPTGYKGEEIYVTEDGIMYSILNGNAVFKGYATELTDHVIIPEEVEGYTVASIGRSAFYGNDALTNIYIPSCVTSIGMEAFDQSGLTNIYYQGTYDEWETVSKGHNAVSEYTNILCEAELVEGHIYVDDVGVTTEPTCTEEGEGVRECRICGEHQTVTVPALGHDLIHHDGKEATCTEGGWDEYDTCSRCDYTTYTATESKGHTPEVLEAVAPTCTENGLTEGSRCAVCGETLTMQLIVNALGHDFHVVEGSAVEPTCTTDGKEADQVCSRCGELQEGTYLQASGHTEIELYAVEPTCTEPGLTAGKKCYFCGEILEAQEEIPATGHSWGEWTVVKEATADEDGLMRRVCANDASHIEEEVIPKTGGEDPSGKPELIPQTLWDKTESWGSPHFSNVENEGDLEIVSVVSSDTDVLEIQYHEGLGNIFDYILWPVKAGTSTVMVTYVLDGVEGSASAVYTVKEFPVFITGLTVDGNAINTEDYYDHNYYDIPEYKGTSPNIKFTVADGWNLDRAYWNVTVGGKFEEKFLNNEIPEAGWTYEFPEEGTRLNAFFAFKNNDGDTIQFGVRFSRPEGGVDPGDETVLDTIEITNINTELIPGQKPEFTAELLSDNMTVVNERWFRTDQMKILTGESDDLPEVGEEYIYFITVSANEGYEFADNPTVKYNGEVVGAVITADNETDISIGDIIPPVTVTAQERITAVYERVTPFEVIMERDFKNYGDGLQYYGKTIDYPDAGEKVTFTFPDGTTKVYVYERKGSSYGKFVNVDDSTDVINYSNIYINIYNQSDEWEPGGDKNYYEVTFINYPEDASEWITCRVPIEVSSTPVASVEYEPVPVLLWANDAGRSGMPAESKVTVTYKDGTSEVFVDDYEKHSWISQETNEPIPANDNIYYEIYIERDRENLSCTASYMGVTSEKNYGAIYVAQSISLHQEEPMVLKKGKNSTTKTDAAGNEYEEYELYKYDWFGENDVLTVTYKNGMEETIDVDYVTDGETSFYLAEDSDYHSGYPDDYLSGNYITIHMPDQSENHFEVGKTYSMDMTYHVVGSNFELPAFTTEGEPYKVLIEEVGPEDVTSVSFVGGSSVAKVKKDETLQLAVSWEPSYANVPADAITWTSSDFEVATVDNNGLVTAVSEGSTQITVKIGEKTAYKNVVVYEEKVLTDETVSLSQTVFPYTGNIVNIDGCVLYNGETVPRTYCSFQYTAIGAEGQPPREIGDYKVVITGSYGGYSGSATEYFTIKGDLTRNATNLNVTLDADEYVYSGSPVEPEIVSITAKGKGGGIATLVEGQDYTVSYMNNTAAGTGFVIISAIEDSYYRGEKMIPFTITEAVKDGWIREGDDWYYYENGNMVTSKWRKDGDDWCYLGPDGKRVSSKWQ
nr:Ig-like domain-containing protein [Clostridiales bacterium]